MKWDAVFFDFDGVILDSVNVKTEAFAHMFRPYGVEVEKAVVEYHLHNGGVSRFDKFRYYYEQILGQPITEEKITELADTFSELVLHRVINSKFIPGALSALEEVRHDKIPAYIVSGTPENEIRHIAQQRGLSHYFVGIYGAPRKKEEIVRAILMEQSYNPVNCLFIGDSGSDYNAAMKTGLQFLGVVVGKNLNPFPEGTTISDQVCLQIPPHQED